MAFYKKKAKEPYLTPADRERIAKLDNNPLLEYRKNKVGITLKHPKISAEIYIVCYGKDNENLKENISVHVDFFKSKDKLWKLVNVVDLKSKEILD